MVKILLLFFALLSATPPTWAASSTPNLGMVKPTPVPGSWAADINKNFDILDAKFPLGFAESTYTINGSLHYCADAGTDDAYVCNKALPPLAYITGSWIEFRPNTVNTGAATVNVNGLGIKAIVQHDGSVLTNGMLAAGRSYRLVYDGTSFRMPPGGAGGIGAETDPNVAKINGLVKSDGATIAPAVVNTDYAAAAHGARHQNGGADEISTATAAANAIPKAGAGGILGQGWIGASMYDGSQHYAPDAGGTDAYAGSLPNAPTAYTTGMWIELKVNTTNTGTATINLNSLGVKSILKHDGTALADGDLVATRSYRLVYDGTAFRIPPAGTGTGTITGSGTPNSMAMFTAAGTIGDATGTPTTGDCSTNCLTDDYTGITGLKTRTKLNADGAEAVTTGTLTNGKVPQFDSLGRLIDGTSLAALKTKQVVYRHGSDTGSVLADTEDEANIWPERIAAMTITSVKCWSDAGTPIINLQRDDGTAANILSANLTCTTAGATGTIAVAEDNLATTDKVNFTMVTGGGTAKRLTVSIMATVD